MPDGSTTTTAKLTISGGSIDNSGESSGEWPDFGGNFGEETDFGGNFGEETETPEPTAPCAPLNLPSGPQNQREEEAFAA